MKRSHLKLNAIILLMVGLAIEVKSQHRSGECEHTLGILQDTEIGNFDPDLPTPTVFTIRAKAGTSGGNDANTRSLFQFDLSGFDSLQTIDSAFLYLYAATSSAGNNHGTEDGTNESYLRRITSQWDQNTATWNNSPAYTNTNEVLLPMTTSPNEHKEHINVTQLIQDMVTNPSHSFGFYFALSIESAYRRMIFASSDNADTSLHPKLVVYSCDLVGMNELSNRNQDSKIRTLHIEENRLILETVSEMKSIRIYDVGGQLIFSAEPTSNWIGQDFSASKGIYFIRVSFSDGSVTHQKLLNF